MAILMFVLLFVGVVSGLFVGYQATNGDDAKSTMTYVGVAWGSFMAWFFLQGMPLQLFPIVYAGSGLLLGLGSLIWMTATQKDTKKIGLTSAVLSGVVFFVCVIVSFGSGPVFRADSYRDQLTITKKVYGLPELTQSTKIPVDIALAEDLMKKAIPPELSSRYEAGVITRQADSRGNILYVAPMEHTGVVAAIFNGKTPGYIMMDASDSSSVKAVMVDNQGKPITLAYSNNSVGMQDINTYIHLKTPTELVDNAKFYLDDEGNPYWVALSQRRTIGVSGFDTKGVIVVNAQTGEMKEYSLKDNIPSWIDRLYDANQLEEQVDNHFKYVHGFFNASKLEVRELIGNADYVQLGDQTYMYMTIGNKNNDTMTTGAVLVNTRTKEATYYERKVFSETEVVKAAEQLYREKGYSAGNPLLRSIEGNLVFVVQMHGAASTISGYVIRSAYPQGPISSGATLAEAYQNYVQKMMESPNVSMAKQAVASTIEGMISQIGNEVVNGNTVYSMRVEGNKDIFVVARTVSPELPLLSKGVVIIVEYRKGINGVNTVYRLKVKD